MASRKLICVAIINLNKISIYKFLPNKRGLNYYEEVGFQKRDVFQDKKIW
ncbi:hypothetical protein Sta7437_2894 [Stanieria cyanosphaera PCC 7437]|uniref:Uncharacterized protein n=1 Tax=Stanieria cyanosphaera (strain ATCC 29371 / PCC 7437) TaxID=111780 RepID=K9XV44_STAC7|nr:hypothetical protein Sta7437_2894 [Stanieria cyanosphaera PCC 7437]